MPRIHDFEIIGAIGRGQFSEVHRALWRAGGDRVLVEHGGGTSKWHVVAWPT